MSSQAAALQPGMRVRCAFGAGMIQDIDWDKKRVTIKLDNGTIQFVNPQEVEKSITMGPLKAVGTTVTTTETAGGMTKVVKSVSTTTKTTTTTTSKAT